MTFHGVRTVIYRTDYIMKIIKGNKYLLSTLESMTIRKKPAHTVLFWGEKGSGRKLMAKYYTKQLLCEAPDNGRPCGQCTSCRNVDMGYHPDVMYVPRSGKLGGYSVETARSVISSAFVRPNNSSGRKVYIFADCHNMDPRTQNALLKLVEEPPDYAYFIFTAESKSDFLPTIISRCVSFRVSVCTEEEAREALADEGRTPEEIDRAVECFHGNIGMGIRYLIDDELKKQVDLTKSIADSIIRKDEYAMNTVFFSLGKERNDVRCVLSMLDMLIRDAAVLSEDAASRLVGCYRSGAESLSRQLTSSQAAKIHRRIEHAWRAVEANVGIPLVLAALCAEITEII